MFDLLFKYPWTAYQKGQFVLLSGWPVWLLIVLMVSGSLFLGWLLWRRRANFGMRLKGLRSGAIWVLQSLALVLLLLMLWQPALSVSTLKPQQNVVAVLVDDSRSMALADIGKPRYQAARDALNSGFLTELKKRFQVRTYRTTAGLERVESLDALNGKGDATRLGDALKAATGEAATLPVGAIVLLSDGADNSGGVDLESMAEIRRFRIPVHTVGFGSETMRKDIEISAVDLPARALGESRLSALVSYRQNGFAGQRAKLTAREGDKVLAQREVTLKGDGVAASEALVFNAGASGAKSIRFGLDPLEGEENRDNNARLRLVNVEPRKMRVLYLEGEPRWEMKFVRRALEEDKNVELVSILRTTQNKIYRQGIKNPNELEEGFPAKVEELFAYDGIILGAVEAGYFTPAQLELLRTFVDRRGGGLLFLGGRTSLSEGGWHRSALAELMPVSLPDRKGTFHREPAVAELTSAGRDSLICQLEENNEKNAQRWKQMPHLADYQETGVPKPGAVVLLEMTPTSRGRYPLLTIQKYGRGRVAVMATGGSWRWQMLQDSKDKTHEAFWQQLTRWLVTDVPGKVTLTTGYTVLEDQARMPLRVEVRDDNYSPVSDASVDVRILGPNGLADQVTLQPDPSTPGLYSGEWPAPKPGSYLSEAIAKRGTEEAGRDVVTFQRQNGVAENFRVEQNKELLERLAMQTGGKYYKPDQLKKLEDDIALSEAGMTIRETRDLWDMPFLLLLLAALKGGEWLLRRKWGLI